MLIPAGMKKAGPLTRPLERPKQDVRLAAGALVRHDVFQLPEHCFYVVECFGDVLRGRLGASSDPLTFTDLACCGAVSWAGFRCCTS